MVCRKASKNGGAGIFIRDSLEYSELDLSKFNLEQNLEISGIKLANLEVAIVSLYRSPCGNMDLFFDNFEQAIKKVLQHTSKLVIGGDFNIPFHKTTDTVTTTFVNILRSLNLVAINKAPTRNDSCLDNILVNFSRDCYELKVLNDCISDHNPLLLNLKLDRSCRPNETVTSSKKCMRKQNETQIKLFAESLESERWEIIDTYKRKEIDIETLFNSFLKTYNNIWYLSSPLVKISVKSKQTKKLLWYNEDLKRGREIMLGYFDVFKNLRKTGSQHMEAAYNLYKFFKKEYRKKLNLAKRACFENHIEGASNKCKAAWEVISSETQNNTGVTPTTLDPHLTNQYFIQSVADIQTNIDNTDILATNLLANTLTNCVPQFTWSLITPTDVTKVAAKLSNSKTSDFYGISNYIVKNTIKHISSPLAFIFNQCLLHGYFPDLLKISKVLPVYKKGDRSLPQSYRPISIVPILSKVFESIMYHQLNQHFESNNIISNNQHGFRTNKSTTSAVTEIVVKALHAFEQRESVALTLIDLSKAFDCVNHGILLDKLKIYGISENSINILQSYLSNRVQYVSVQAQQSTTLSVATGVPQGSVLGPFLFIIFINDLPSNVLSNIVIYADDTTLFSSNKQLNTLKENMDASHSLALNWFTSNRLICNQEKTQNLLLSLSENYEDQSVKLLGFHLDSKLNWKSHIDHVCRKISRVLYLMWKLRDFVSCEYLRVAYFAFFQSHISYGIVLWGHSNAVNDILLIQKKVVRTISRSSSLEHCKPLFINLKFMTVINLYIFHILVYTKLHITDFNTRQDFHQHNTRGKNKLDLPQHRLVKTGNSFKFNCITFYNKLPASATMTPFNIFKLKISNWLICNPFYSLKEFLDSDINIIF
uniref:Reverse transcriptase domain-containing protein n=1 Tax=Homalodisca liturata TaxID=320908 RepID=A0A1B6HJN6_9HEMI